MTGAPTTLTKADRRPASASSVRMRALKPALALLAALALAACGDSEDATDATVQAAPVPPAAVTPPETPAAPAIAGEPTPIEGAVPAPADAVAPVIPDPEPPAPVVEPAPAAAPGPAPAAEPRVAVAAETPVPPAEPDRPVTPVPDPIAVEPPAVAEAPAAQANPATPAIEAPDIFQRIANADVGAGEDFAATQCTVCHSLGEGERPIIGPNLYDVVGARIGGKDGYTYSPAMAAQNAAGAIWTFEQLDAFLADPAAAIPGTRMSFTGIPDEDARANVIAYLRTLSADPEPLPEAETAVIGFQAPGLAPATFDAQQLSNGRDHYTRFCNQCHGTFLQGVWFGGEWGSAPALAGHKFIDEWYQESLYVFFRSLQDVGQRPFHQPLTPERNADLLAYILERNGFVVGDTPLPTDPDALRGMGFYQYPQEAP